MKNSIPFSESKGKYRCTEFTKLDRITSNYIGENDNVYLSDFSLSISSSSSMCSLKEKKSDNWTDVTKQLGLFAIKKNEQLIGLEESKKESSVSEIDSDFEYEVVARKKKYKVKKLIKSNQLKSIRNPSVLLNSNLDRKKNCKYLYLKYNLYKKEFVDYYYNFYVMKIERARHIYSKKYSRKLDEKFLIENKSFFKSLKLIDKIIKSQKVTKIDKYIVDFNQVDKDLEQNADEVYLNFLIQIQHREITPEDYEYLSRLDEFVKKKTLSDEILKSLKTDTADEWLTKQKCGICHQEYEYADLCKFLPCDHVFHSDCIDSWLKISVNCPLDNLSVEESWKKNVEIEKNVKDVIKDLMNKIEQENT